MSTKHRAPEPITLIAPYFCCSNQARQSELDECLIRNAKNRLIDRIILLIDDDASPPLQANKIEIYNLEERPTYADWLSIIEEKQLQGPVLLANSDIYFDDSLELIHQVLTEPFVFMALSRWEIEDGSTRKHPNPHWSQDVWAILGGSADLHRLRDRLGFKLGVPRCDNKVAYVFATSGWSVRNPCNFLRSFHLQESQVRTYDKKADTTIVGAVAYVEPSPAPNHDSALHFDVWTVKSHEVLKVTVNNSLEKWRRQANVSPPTRALRIRKTEKSRVTIKPGSRHDLFANGRRVYSNFSGMGIYEKDERILAAPSFNPRDWLVINKTTPLQGELSCRFLKPMLDEHLAAISERPKHETDVNFWQYPCRTEQQAMENHSAIREPSIDGPSRTINIYVPLPWATYIDNKEFPETILSGVTDRLAFLTSLTEILGYSLQVHTVCQHIRWRNMRAIAERAGITDLHISHCTAEARAEMKAAGSSLRLHPWTLYAVNYCDNSRNKGLVIGKPMRERRYLASFIGAYMPHYLSDIRIRLAEGLSALQATDILIDLGDLWHFNQVVYDHQVKMKYSGQTMPVDLDDKVVRYNRVLSDSRFSLCPEGAGPNTLRLWESIAVGAIPVLFNHSLELPEFIRASLTELCLFYEETDYGKPFYDWLRSFPDEDLERRSRELRALYAKIQRITCF